MLAINGDARRVAGNGSEISFAITSQDQSTPCIQPRHPGPIRKEILREKNVFVAIEVEVRNGGAENRSELRIERQWTQFEMRFAVQQDDVAQFRDAPFFSASICVSKKCFQAAGAVRLVIGVLGEQKRKIRQIIIQ